MENAIQVDIVPAKQGETVNVQKPRADPFPKPNIVVPKKKVKKIKPKLAPKLKELKLLPSLQLDAAKPAAEKILGITLDEKLKQITMLAYGKADLKNTLEDKDKMKDLTNEFIKWLTANNSKTLEILTVFKEFGKDNCLTYSQFVGTMINVEAPFRIKDLCTLVIHLSSQKAGLIAEKDIEDILKKPEPTECDICGLGKAKLVQAKMGPFGILQTSLNLPEMNNKNKSQEGANRWVKFLADSFVKKDRAIDLDNGKNSRFKSAFINWTKQKDQFSKPAVKNGPAEPKQAFLNIAKRTVRARGIFSDWQKGESKAEMQVDSEGNHRLFKRSSSRKRIPEYDKVKNNTGTLQQSDLPAHLGNIGSLSRRVTRHKTCWQTNREERKVRFKIISAKVAEDIKKNVPSILGVIEKTTEKFVPKKRLSRPRSQRLSFLKLPEEDEELLAAFSQRQNQPVDFFVLLQLRSIIYDSVLSCPAHFSLLLTSNTTLEYVAHHIKEVNDISRADIYISPYRLSLRQSLLRLENTLKQCGYRGYCKSHPQQVTLYYDFDISYVF